MFGVAAGAMSDDPRQAPRLARAAGFEGVQFDVDGAVNLAELSATGRRDFRHALSAQDQQLAGLRADVGAKGLTSSADMDRIITRLDTSMETAAGLGPKLLCVDLGPLPAPAVEAQPRKRVREDEAGMILLPTAEEIAMAAPAPAGVPITEADVRLMGQVDGVMSELGRRADRYGVTCAFRSDLASLAALERALKAADCPWFGVDLDPAGVLRDEWDEDTVFSRLGGMIRHVRGRDALRGADRRTKATLIGQGNVQWERLFSNLDEAGYGGWVTVDTLELPARAAAARAGVEFLKSVAR